MANPICKYAASLLSGITMTIFRDPETNPSLLPVCVVVSHGCQQSTNKHRALTGAGELAIAQLPKTTAGQYRQDARNNIPHTLDRNMLHGSVHLVTGSDPLLELGKSTDLPACHFLILSCGAGVHPASEFLSGVLCPWVDGPKEGT